MTTPAPRPARKIPAIARPMTIPVRKPARCAPSLGTIRVRPQVALDKGIHRTVEHGLRIADFETRPVVFDHRIGVQDVGSDLIAPTRLDVLSLEARLLGF